MCADKTDSVFKFASADTAVQILSNGTLRWSAPDCFRDPLELSHVTPLSFELNSFLDSTIKLATSMIFAPETPKGDSPLINAIVRWRDDERFANAAEAQPILRELLGKMVNYRLEQLHISLSKWQMYIRNLRLSCFCQHLDNPANWEQFAEQHRGIALRFERENSSWENLRPVVYQSERPQLTSLREQLGALLHNRPDTVSQRFQELFFIKAPHHQSESEWRASSTAKQEVPLHNNDWQQWYEDRPFPSAALTGIYLGLGTTEEMKERVLQLAQQHFPQSKTFQARLGKTGYNLEFEKLR